MKKYFLIIIIFILTSCISKYKTSTLFEDGGYKYNITYPVSKHNEWSLFYGATDSTIYQLEDGSIFQTTNIISKQKPNPGSAIEVYILNKDSFSYKSLLESIKENDFKLFIINDISRKAKSKLSVNNIYDWIKNKDDKMLSVIYEIGNNKVILFVISENSKDKKKTGREIYKIISSLTREKINNE